MDKITKLIDEGGRIHKEIKDKTSELDDIKKELRTELGEKKMSEAYGTEYIVSASSYITTTVDKDSVIKSFIGKRPAQIDPEEDITLRGKDLLRLLMTANFTVGNLKKVFTEDGMKAVTTSISKDFYTIGFKKIN